MDEVDDSIAPFPRLQEYLKSNEQFKLQHCTECVIDCVSDVDFNQVNSILIPAIQFLLQNDDEEVSESMLVMIPDFVDSLYEVFPDNAVSVLTTVILPLVHNSIENESDQFAESYASLAVKLPTDYFLANEVPYLQELVQSEDAFIRMTVASILLFLVEHIDPSLYYDSLLSILTTLSTDDDEDIRAKIPALIALFTKQLKSPRQKALLSGKIVLFTHDSCSDVRTATAECLTTLCLALDPSSRLVTVIPVVRLLLNDQCEQTRNTMRSNLGPIISQLGKFADRSLVSQFCNSLFSPDVNICFPSAYSFPAVALSIGPERFDELRSGLESAASSREYKVRRTLSFGLIEFASILKKEFLLELLTTFLKDIPTVAIGIFTNYDIYLKLIEDRKDEFLTYLQNPQRYSEWRLRLTISQQCRKLTQFFQREDLLEIVKPLTNDKVYTVRKDAAITFSLFMDEQDVEFIKTLSDSSQFYEREEAANIIEYSSHNWIQEFVKILQKLSDDHVANVRIAAAKATKKLIKKFGFNSDLNNLIKKFEADSDIDVKKATEDEIDDDEEDEEEEND